jgi:hypothetical protein
MSWKDIMKQVDKDKIEHIRELLFDYDNEEVGKKIDEAMEDMPRRKGFHRLAHKPPRSHKDKETRDKYWQIIHEYLDALESEME